MALKSEFDVKSFRIVLIRSLIGVVLGAIPGTIYIISTGQNRTANPLGLVLLQTGCIVGALAFGLASLAGTLIATMKNRGTGPKTNRIKEYLNPETLPAIPSSPKVENKTVDSKENKVTLSTAAEDYLSAAPEVKPITQTLEPPQPSFEDYDR